MSKKKKHVKLVPHQFNRKIRHWLYCNGCGLLALKNKPTEDRIRAGCDTEDNPVENLYDF